MADQSTLSDTEKAQADAAFAEALRKVSLSENAGGNGDAASVTSTSATAASSEYEDDVDEDDADNVNDPVHVSAINMDAVKKITAVLAPHLHDRAIAITNFILLFDSVRVDFEDDPMFAGGPLSDLLNLALVIFQEDEVVFGQVEKVFDKIVAGAVDEDDDEEEEDAEGSDEDNEEINDEEIEDDGDEMEMDM